MGPSSSKLGIDVGNCKRDFGTLGDIQICILIQDIILYVGCGVLGTAVRAMVVVRVVYVLAPGQELSFFIGQLSARCPA